MLQPIASSQPSYFKDSFEFKQLITPLSLPIGARLFTCDAKSMYTNIPTEPAIACISAYLRSIHGKPFQHYHPQTLIDAIEIIFRNNVIQFAQDTINWCSFKQTMQQWHGLQWDFTPLSTSCNFMDLTITITPSGHLSTTLYEKAQNLYLYIPPHSAHPSGMLSGLVHGNILRIHRLCSSPEDIKRKSSEFFTRLTHRGYTTKQLTPLFTSARQRALLYNPTPPPKTLYTKTTNSSSISHSTQKTPNPLPSTNYGILS
eukprot:CCRYP_014145-RB/>CCRYP_014145-RB protein AED:0.31 eAED:0.31 QI:0/0/0/1/0/0/2/0/257